MSRLAMGLAAIAMAAAMAALASCTSVQLPELATLSPVPPLTPLRPTDTPTATTVPTVVASPTPAATTSSDRTTAVPQRLLIRWPDRVSALDPVPIEVELVPSPGVQATTALTAVIRHSREGLVYQAPLLPRDGYVYAAAEPLHLPLTPPSGTYRLIILLSSTIDTVGDRVVYFQPEPIPLHDLDPGSDTGVHEGVQLAVPLEFTEVIAEGGPWAGRRIWRHPEGEVGLWWAPGPTKALLFTNAVAMLETTHDPEDAPQVRAASEVERYADRAFLFEEHWPGSEGGPGEALVVQGPDYWLYVLRIRARGAQVIPPVLELVRDTLAFAE